ncbi:MAG: TetR/AcrR family transcriptional regulator [Lysobacterales bacterium]|jgi:TetR/AcrR family transcriptional repressor of nem operon
MIQATNTREQIIEQAFQLMMRRGVNGFSYRDISEPLGIRNAAVHYHFPSKMDLVKTLIEEQHEVLRKGTAQFMAYGGPALPQIEGMFRHTLKQYEHGRPVCMAGALSVDFEDLPDDARSALEGFMRDMTAWLTKVLEVGRSQGEFRFDGDAESKATSIVAMIQGARQLARMQGRSLLERLFSRIRIDLGVDA